MNAHNEIKKSFDLNLDARPALAAVQLRFAAWVDALVARWLERCAADIEATQRSFRIGPRAVGGRGQRGAGRHYQLAP